MHYRNTAHFTLTRDLVGYRPEPTLGPHPDTVQFRFYLDGPGIKFVGNLLEVDRWDEVLNWSVSSQIERLGWMSTKVELVSGC